MLALWISITNQLREDIKKKTVERVKMALLRGVEVRKIIEFSSFTNDEKHGRNFNFPIYDYLHWVFDLSCLVSSCFDSDDVKLISNLGCEHDF